MTARDWADEKAKEILHKCRWADATYNADVIALALRQAHAKGRAEAFSERWLKHQPGFGYRNEFARWLEARAKEFVS